MKKTGKQIRFSYRNTLCCFCSFPFIFRTYTLFRFAAFALFLLFISSLYAEVPIRFTYQGNIRQDGILVSGNRNMAFAIYDSSYSTTALWSSATESVSVSTGVFRVVLEPNLPRDKWDSSSLWLEIEIEGNKLAPREQINASIYSINTLLHSGKKYTTSSTEPLSPISGDLWYDSSSNTVKFFNGSVWMLTSGGSGDNLGNHIAITTLNMNSWDIGNISTITFLSNVYISSTNATNYGGIYISTNVYTPGDIHANKFYGDGNGLLNLNGSNLVYQSVSKEKIGSSGCLVGQTLQWNGAQWVCVTVSGGGIEADPLSIHLQENLQEGATFYVSSGTVNYFTVNNSFLSLAHSIFTSSVSILSPYGLYSPRVDFGSDISVSSAAISQYGGVYISTHQFVNGSVYAQKFYGDGSELTGISGDNLGNHIATTTLNMSNFPIINISSMSITGANVSGSEPLLEVAGSTMVVLNNGNVGIGTNVPQAKLEVDGPDTSGEYVAIYKSGNKLAAWLRNK